MSLQMTTVLSPVEESWICVPRELLLWSPAEESWMGVKLKCAGFWNRRSCRGGSSGLLVSVDEAAAGFHLLPHPRA